MKDQISALALALIVMHLFGQRDNGTSQIEAKVGIENPRAFFSPRFWHESMPDARTPGDSVASESKRLTVNRNNWTSNPVFNEGNETHAATPDTLKTNNTSIDFRSRSKLLTARNECDLKRFENVHCTGALNNGPLYTFNMVPTGPNQINMYHNSWTWVKTSGSATWSSSNGGKNMTFTINLGCSTFNAYNTSCNVTFTFCKGSMWYIIFDAESMIIVKQGTTNSAEGLEVHLNSLPSGTYILDIDGRQTLIRK